ncbi:MAG: CoA transferase [Rhodobiaceae bacterium]|nr:CoA transferase [Rhodobiaceae bacterium]
MGPLKGVKIVEFGAIGPATFATMLLSDMGADVIRVDRTSPSGLGIKKEPRHDTMRRGRPSIAVNLKSEEGCEVVRKLVAQADGLTEGFRPGVMERLGFGPDACLALNERLVYGRMTGWGQDGPLAQHVGHDVNYLAITGALSMIGRKGTPPAIPLNLVADLGGGALYLAFGMACALFEAQRSGKGQVVDAAIIDGIASMMTGFFAYRDAGRWNMEFESNFIDGGAPFYDVYETKDGKFITVGAIEAKFYADLVKAMGLDIAQLPPQMDQSSWPALKVRFAEIFKTKTREEWGKAMEGYEACFAPVLDMDEALKHPQYVERKGFETWEGVPHPAAAPRLSRTPGKIQGAPRADGQDTDTALTAWGFGKDELAELHKSGAIA